MKSQLTLKVKMQRTCWLEKPRKNETSILNRVTFLRTVLGFAIVFSLSVSVADLLPLFLSKYFDVMSMRRLYSFMKSRMFLTTNEASIRPS